VIGRSASVAPVILRSRFAALAALAGLAAATAVAVLAVGAVSAGGGGRDLTARGGARPGTPAGHAARTPAAVLAGRAPSLPATWQAGVNLTANAGADFLAPGSDAALAAARRDRSTAVEVVATWYMTGADSSAVAADPARTPTDAAVMHAVTTATGLGLRVLLKPQVDVLDGTFRGEIAPADRAAWFASYQTMLVHYADLARQLNVQGLVVGVELGSMVDRPGDTNRWKALIRSVRGAGFHGRLTYATNWDQLSGIGFWRSVDYIGIDAYFPLVPKDRAYSPTTSELEAAWHGSYVAGGPRDWVAEVTRLQRAERRPVVFTELGYGATACTADVPYVLAPRCVAGGQTKPSERAQRNAYVAAMRVWSRVPHFAGIYWWDWPTDANQAGDFYSARGKLAEQSIALWNAARGAHPH
jgi:hypothetical protein